MKNKLFESKYNKYSVNPERYDWHETNNIQKILMEGRLLVFSIDYDTAEPDSLMELDIEKLDNGIKLINLLMDTVTSMYYQFFIKEDTLDKGVYTLYEYQVAYSRTKKDITDKNKKVYSNMSLGEVKKQLKKRFDETNKEIIEDMKLSDENYKKFRNRTLRPEDLF